MKKAIRFSNALLILIMLVSIGVTQQTAQAQRPTADIPDGASFMPGEIVVKFKSNPGVPAAQVASALAGTISATVVQVDKNGVALLATDPDTDIEGLAASIAGQAEVEYAEPNFVYSIPKLASVNTENIKNLNTITRVDSEGKTIEVSTDLLQSLKMRKGSRTLAVYPNDPYLWRNLGWSVVEADIVSNNRTSSKNVCVIDTGVDYLHKDLKGKVIKGKDYVNNDTNPMDDNGHGTFVAGIIAAKQGNREGIAGVSTGRVVAMKALNAKGEGTSYEVAEAIYGCANRTDISIINMSLGGGRSQFMEDAIGYAVNDKNKLVVAAAGNNGMDLKTYPAAFSENFPNKVIAVASSGYVEYDEVDDYYYLNTNCMSDFSNYGSWVDMAAPGYSIFSTMPYDKPFYMNAEGFYSRYDYMSGTSMAAPFVAASAARIWGYKPAFTNAEVTDWMKSTGRSLDADDVCWPASMANAVSVSVAGGLERGAIISHAMDSASGTPLSGATVLAYQNGALRGTGITMTDTYSYYSDGRKNTGSEAYAEVINLPVTRGGLDYTIKISKSGYTSSPQAAFSYGYTGIFGGYWTYAGEAMVPPKNANFSAVASWSYTDATYDLVTFLPSMPKPIADGQSAPFVVNPTWGNDSGYLESDPTGTLLAFPYARQVYDLVEFYEPANQFDTTVVRNRPGLSALPYYTGEYTFMVTKSDTVDSLAFDYNDIWVTLWKDGSIKARSLVYCDQDWWKAFTITSGRSGAPSIELNDECGSAAIKPY